MPNWFGNSQIVFNPQSDIIRAEDFKQGVLWEQYDHSKSSSGIVEKRHDLAHVFVRDNNLYLTCLQKGITRFQSKFHSCYVNLIGQRKEVLSDPRIFVSSEMFVGTPIMLYLNISFLNLNSDLVELKTKFTKGLLPETLREDEIYRVTRDNEGYTTYRVR